MIRINVAVANNSIFIFVSENVYKIMMKQHTAIEIVNFKNSCMNLMFSL
eukprot:SAG31_NODE_5185_length_2693_cov_8.272938_2_plen_49_part_00